MSGGVTEEMVALFHRAKGCDTMSPCVHCDRGEQSFLYDIGCTYRAKKFFALARAQVLEEAAKVCEAHRTTPGSELAETIRKMKG